MKRDDVTTFPAKFLDQIGKNTGKMQRIGNIHCHGEIRSLDTANTTEGQDTRNPTCRIAESLKNEADTES